MFKPSEEKSAKSHELINRIFAAKMGDTHNYTVAYAYFMKSGIFGNKMFSYVVGVNTNSKTMVIIPIDSDGNSGEVVTLQKDDIASAKKGMQGDVKIKTTGKAEYRLIVPEYTPSTLESAYILPIIQSEPAAKFAAFIKENF